jgi:hypothetical protein
MPSLLTAIGILVAAVAVADPPIHMEPRRPFSLSPGAAHPVQEKVWSAVILASNATKGEQPASPPPELAPFAPKLSKFFGYDQFAMLGSATKVMDGQTERWLVPTQNFWVGAKATREAGGYRLSMEFFHDKRCILETEAILGPKSPIFVRGPMHKRGQIIVVFEVKP